MDVRKSALSASAALFNSVFSDAIRRVMASISAFNLASCVVVVVSILVWEWEGWSKTTLQKGRRNTFLRNVFRCRFTFLRNVPLFLPQNREESAFLRNVFRRRFAFLRNVQLNSQPMGCLSHSVRPRRAAFADCQTTPTTPTHTYAAAAADDAARRLRLLRRCQTTRRLRLLRRTRLTPITPPPHSPTLPEDSDYSDAQYASHRPRC